MLSEIHCMCMCILQQWQQMTRSKSASWCSFFCAFFFTIVFIFHLFHLLCIHNHVIPTDILHFLFVQFNFMVHMFEKKKTQFSKLKKKKNRPRIELYVILQMRMKNKKKKCAIKVLYIIFTYYAMPSNVAFFFLFPFY